LDYFRVGFVVGLQWLPAPQTGTKANLPPRISTKHANRHGKGKESAENRRLAERNGRFATPPGGVEFFGQIYWRQYRRVGKTGLATTARAGR
jgi:hypothetical protein